MHCGQELTAEVAWLQVKSSTRAHPLDKGGKAKMMGLIGAHKHGIRSLAAEDEATPQLQRLANAPKRIKGTVIAC